LSWILSLPPIEEATTAILLAFAINALGNFFGRHYGKLEDGKRRLVSKLGRSPQNSSTDSPAETKKKDEGCPWNEVRGEREPSVGPFLIFGLLYSALAYFAFVHASGALGIPQYVEPTISFVISVVAAVPLLFYLMYRNR
jgi:hypothetical protein